jgi:hypothetical protein
MRVEMLMRSVHHFILSVLVMFCMIGCASLQPIPESDRTFSRVIDAEGFTKDQIFDSSRYWIEANLFEAKDMIEYEDKPSGTIISNGIISYPDPINFYTIAGYKKHIIFKMRIDSQNDKFKTIFSNIKITHLNNNGEFSEDPLSFRGDLDVVKTELLKFGDEILASMKRAKGSSN